MLKKNALNGRNNWIWKNSRALSGSLVKLIGLIASPYPFRVRLKVYQSVNKARCSKKIKKNKISSNSRKSRGSRCLALRKRTKTNFMKNGKTNFQECLITKLSSTARKHKKQRTWFYLRVLSLIYFVKTVTGKQIPTRRQTKSNQNRPSNSLQTRGIMKLAILRQLS